MINHNMNRTQEQKSDVLKIDTQTPHSFCRLAQLNRIESDDIL